MKKGEQESGNTSTASSNMISLGPQTVSGNEHQTLYKGKARLDKNVDSRSNCVVMPIGDGRLNGGIIPMYPFVPNFVACKMGTPFPFPGPNGPITSFGLMRELEIHPTKNKDGERATSPSNTVRNTIGFSPTVVSHQIEISSLSFVKTNPASHYSTGNSSELTQDEETESSSTHSDQSSDSDFEDEERVLVRNWERQRCNIAWKWSWLQLQMKELKNQLKDYEKQAQDLKTKKHNPIPEFTEDQCARTAGVVPPKEFVKLSRRPTQAATVLERSSHLVLKVKAPKRKHSSLHVEDEEEFKPSYGTPEVTPKKKKNPAPLRLHTPVTSPRVSRNPISSQSPRISSPKMINSPILDAISPRTRRQRRRDEFCVNNVVIPFSGPSISPRVYKNIMTPSWTEIEEPIDINAALENAIEENNTYKRRSLSPDNDNEQSVPISTTIQVEELPTVPGTGELIDFAYGSNELEEHKPIADQQSLMERNQMKESNEPKDDTKDSVPPIDNTNEHVRLLSESKEILIESMSSEEDTSDEAFAQRHFCRELLERKRYLFPDKNKNLPTTPQELPAEFFVDALVSPKNKKKKANTMEEMDKLKHKFEKIRSRYLISFNGGHQSWEDLSFLAPKENGKTQQKEEEEEGENSFPGEWDSGCGEFFVSDEEGEEDEDYVESIEENWEIVSKSPLFDEQGRERNILYLRRIIKPVAIVE